MLIIKAQSRQFLMNSKDQKYINLVNTNGVKSLSCIVNDSDDNTIIGQCILALVQIIDITRKHFLRKRRRKNSKTKKGYTNTTYQYQINSITFKKREIQN